MRAIDGCASRGGRGPARTTGRDSKGTDLRCVTAGQLAAVADETNHRPPKSLDWAQPAQLFARQRRAGRSPRTWLDRGRVESVDAEAERVGRRVQEHPEGSAGLVLVLGGSEPDDRAFGKIEVVDHHV
jgi:hypothetical protein